jgi:ABC-type antimicrobial peptide transport system permease subunit
VGIRLAAAGIVIGLVGALGVGQLLSNLISVSPADPLSFAGAALLLTAMAAAASYVPARRAARHNPSATLKRD